jgi:hypothetical protein
MSMANKEKIEDINIDVTEKPVKDEEIVVAKAEELNDADSPQQAIEDVKRQLDTERAARADAERRAQDAAQQAYHARNEVDDTNLHLVNSAIETVKRNNDILKANYREAMIVGDYDKAAEVQEIMSSNQAKLLQLENGRRDMEVRPKQAPPRPADEIEALAVQVTPASANWLRNNRQHLSDSRAVRKMFRAHEDAVDENITPDTREYFQFIEGRLGIGRDTYVAPEMDAMAETAKVTQRRSAPPSAPVSRSGSAPGSRPNVVRLSNAEREMANMMGMTDMEYAKNKQALQKEGKLQ